VESGGDRKGRGKERRKRIVGKKQNQKPGLFVVGLA
jgi:hypothetical protein